MQQRLNANQYILETNIALNTNKAIGRPQHLPTEMRMQESQKQCCIILAAAIEQY